jgi:hypothetical protein
MPGPVEHLGAVAALSGKLCDQNPREHPADNSRTPSILRQSLVAGCLHRCLYDDFE